MLPARIDPKTAMVATATGAPWKCADVPAGLFAKVLPAGSTQSQMIDEAKRWIHAERAAAPAAFAAHNGPRRTISPAETARMGTALASARAAVPASAHAEACFDAVHTGFTSGWDVAVAAERAHLVRLRHTPEARAKLTAFLTKA
jgi:hypothetical protein